MGLKYEDYSGSVEDLVLIGQNQFGVTNDQSKKPVIGTYGIYSCVGLVGYEKDKKIGFVGHIDVGTDISEIKGYLSFQLSKLGELPHNYQVHLLEGDDSDTVKRALEIVTELNFKKEINFEVVEKKSSDLSFSQTDSIGIDTRDGNLYSFQGDQVRSKYDLKRVQPYSFLTNLTYFPGMQGQ